MSNTREIVAAESLEELEQRVQQWYSEAAGEGRSNVRAPWDPAKVKHTESGFYEFEVWAD